MQLKKKQTSFQFVNCAVPSATGNTTILSNLVFI